MEAGQDPVVGQGGQDGGLVLQFAERGGDQAGHDARGAVGQVERRGGVSVFRGSLGEGRAAAAMRVHVDEAGEDPLALHICRVCRVLGLCGRVAGGDGFDLGSLCLDPAGKQDAAWRYHAAAG